MRGIVSFHPVDVEFFDRMIAPLTGGEKVNPEQFLDAARRARIAEWHVKGHKRALDTLLTLLEPPPPPAEGTLWDKVRTRLERFDFKPDPTAALVAGKIEPDLHLCGRPFFICEGSAERVTTIVEEYLQAEGKAALDALALEQMLRIHPELGGKLEPAEVAEPTADASYRNELLNSLKSIFAVAKAAREGGHWGPAGEPRENALEALPRELPWRAVQLHSRAVPFWIGKDVDGLETVCRSADVEPPDVLAPAWGLFSRTIDDFPSLRDALSVELRHERDVGAFVSPDDVPQLLAFLGTEGSRIIQAASRHGVGPTCTTLLRKIRECAHYAERHGMGYLEASGIMPLSYDPEDDAEIGDIPGL
jgi:hypothetical protein